MTSSPVNSRWMPPGHTRSLRHAAKKPSISAMIASKRRVLKPDSVVKTLACMGSEAHRTGWPESRTARRMGGRRSKTLSAPMRAISVSRPGTRSGLRRSQSSTISSGVAVGPTFSPSGLCTPEKNSTWAPSGWRVRSPIQSMCAEQSYQSPVVESRRVSASS